MRNYLLSELSLYLPCYNEELNIEKTFKKTLPVLKKTAQKWEVILINDGSKDNTLNILKKLKKTDPSRIHIVNHPQNRGYGASFKSGIYTARYNWITFIDADGQFDFSEIKNLIAAQKKSNADLVIGYYKKRQVPKFRIWGTAVWQLAVLILFGLKVKDIDCGFKLFRKQVVDTIPRLEAERGPFISSEFLIKSRKAGFKIVEVGVTHFSRRHGSGTGADLNVVLAGLRDLIMLWFKLN